MAGKSPEMLLLSWQLAVGWGGGRGLTKFVKIEMLDDMTKG